MSYIGETSTLPHLRTNQHRLDSNKYNSSTNFNKSAVELKHFNLHKFKNTTTKIFKINEYEEECLFLKSSYMKYYNIIYPFGLNTELFNKL